MRTFIAVITTFFALVVAGPAAAQCTGAAAVCAERVQGGFPLVANAQTPNVYADDADFPGVLRAAADLRDDLRAVSGSTRTALSSDRARGRTLIIVGTIGHSDVIDRMIRDGKLDVTGVAGVWEGYVQQVVERPVRGVDRALVIAGADKRGTIFGIYDLSERMGVSPWAWWADVPVTRAAMLNVAPGRRVDYPRVRYRGIFINDENPALFGWVNEKFGGFNAQFYEHVFELILRLKGNYLWPAMWGKSIYDDDPASPELANEMGVVLGTSHHEPLMRAHVEWERYGEHTPWDYSRNEERLRAFWRAGIERMGDNESLVTIGMRGDGDEAMSEETAIPLLERIVRDQRQIIADVTGRPASAQPQIWALYKEVQDYYDQGMQVPDDVTLLFSDDNWGNIRRLPELGRQRPGGYGIYYHFDYVGGPRNYKWLNTNQIERVWEQMHLAREYGADRVWIVNVGDIKPMEYPISFFLDYAWNPEAMPLERLGDYPGEWAAQQFGPEHAEAIGELLTRYTQYNARRKPEMQDPSTFSLTNYDEMARISAGWSALVRRSEAIGAQLPESAQSAYFQLVAHPILASANLHALYAATARNRLYAAQGRASSAQHADEARRLFANDAQITALYHSINNSKWNHMMSQTHIGYTSWQQPDADVMPELRTRIVPARAGLGVAVEGDERAWPGASGQGMLPEISPYGALPSFEVFNRGSTPFDFTITTGQPWLVVSQESGRVGADAEIEVRVDWAQVPEGEHRVPITIRGARQSVTIIAPVTKSPAVWDINGYIEANGYVAIEAEHFARAVNTNGVTWRAIPQLGRTLSGVAAFPRTVAAQTPAGESPRLEYDVTLFTGGDVSVSLVMAPTMNFTGRGVRYGVSIDDGPVQIVNAHEGLTRSGERDPLWNEWVGNNAAVRTTSHAVTPGRHTVKVWLVDPGLVFERVVLATRELPGSYLGPPESMRTPDAIPAPPAAQ